MKRFATYALSCAAIVVGIGLVAWFVTDPVGHPAIIASACLAFAVQMVAFAVVRWMQPEHLMIGWGVGSVLRLIALGRSNKEIGELLGVSANTVAVHRTNLMATLGVHKAAELVLIAVKRGLVNPQ